MSSKASLLAGSEGLRYGPRSRPSSTWRRSPAAELLADLSLDKPTLACAAELIDLMVERHPETVDHLLGCATVVRNLGRSLGWSGLNLDRLVAAGLLHDVGKLAVPGELLRKPARLTAAERELVQRHAEIGAGLLEGTGLPDLDLAAEVAFHHHERWDGAGYPTGLRGEEIPWAARVVALIDVWDAMRSRRAYRDAHSDAAVQELIRRERGRAFDPDVVDCFLDLDPRLRGVAQGPSSLSVRPVYFPLPA